MVLLNGKIKITQINKKTRAELFGNVQCGDVLYFEYKVETLVRHRRRSGNYAPDIVVKNLRTNEERVISPSQLVNILPVLEYDRLVL